LGGVFGGVLIFVFVFFYCRSGGSGKPPAEHTQITVSPPGAASAAVNDLESGQQAADQTADHDHIQVALDTPNRRFSLSSSRNSVAPDPETEELVKLSSTVNR
jgi:hypothetical protein